MFLEISTKAEPDLQNCIVSSSTHIRLTRNNFYSNSVWKL